jgi:hypothetical protein
MENVKPYKDRVISENAYRILSIYKIKKLKNKIRKL